ncbi:MAG: hypothetical protein ACU84H_07960 [Gammaproteobacteria bacterium]
MNTKIIKFALAFVAVSASGAAIAYEDEKVEQFCKKPKYYDFSLPEYKEPEKIEVAPESEFEFKISVWSDPETIKLTAKKEKLDFTVDSNSSFHLVKSKLPASLNGKFARIDASVKALLGCDQQSGWLVKVADNTKQEAAPASEPSPPAEESAPAATEADKASGSLPPPEEAAP